MAGAFWIFSVTLLIFLGLPSFSESNPIDKRDLETVKEGESSNQTLNSESLDDNMFNLSISEKKSGLSESGNVEKEMLELLKSLTEFMKPMNKYLEKTIQPIYQVLNKCLLITLGDSFDKALRSSWWSVSDDKASKDKVPNDKVSKSEKEKNSNSDSEKEPEPKSEMEESKSESESKPDSEPESKSESESEPKTDSGSESKSESDSDSERKSNAVIQCDKFRTMIADCLKNPEHECPGGAKLASMQTLYDKFCVVRQL